MGLKVKINGISLFLTFLPILPSNRRLVMIQDAAVSYFDKHCQNQVFFGGRSINCRGSMGQESDIKFTFVYRLCSQYSKQDQTLNRILFSLRGTILEYSKRVLKVAVVL